MKNRRKLAVAALGAMVLAGAVMADDVWLSNNATARSDASPAADKVVDLLKGAKVQQVQVQGNWVKVQVNGKVGWVAKSSISVRPQKADSGAFGGMASAQSSSGAAAKGLEPMAMDFAQSQHLSDAGLTQMEQIKKTVTPKMLADFMTEGHVGATR